MDQSTSTVINAILTVAFRNLLINRRRTFLTIAEGIDIPHYALKRLANHRMSNDVTAGYIVADVERLRAPMQAISDELERLCRA